MEKKPHLVPSIVSASLLLGALVDLPYGYFLFLRLVVCFSASFVAYKAYEWKKIWATWLFGFIALLFNPLVIIHLSREIWMPIDIVCAAFFIVSIILFKEPNK